MISVLWFFSILFYLFIIIYFIILFFDLLFSLYSGFTENYIYHI